MNSYDKWLDQLRDASRYLLAQGKTAEALAVQACLTMLGDDSDDESDEWRNAVIDEAATLFVSEEGTPREILKRVIAANVQVALDPAVSREAQALVDRGRAQR